MKINFFKQLKYMFAQSKKLILPETLQSRTDSHRNIHLTLTDMFIKGQQSASTQETIRYLNQLVNLQLKGNQQLKDNYQDMTKAIWVHLSLQNSQTDLTTKVLTQCCNKLQFNMHHGIGKKLSLYRWMTEQKDLVTPYSMFYISCGAVIIVNNHILLVQQKNGSRKGQFGVPGGRADLGETINICAQRQLFQQTGIQAKYRYIIHFRQLSNTLFNGTDIYFACAVQVQSKQNQSEEQKMQRISKQIKLCDRQLNSFRWIHLKDYRNFSSQHAVGTQKQLGRYITELYEKNFDFKSKEHQQTTFPHQIYISKRDGIQRSFIEHYMTR